MLKIGHGFLIIAISPIICLYKDFNMGKLSYLYANIIAFVGSFVVSAAPTCPEKAELN